MLMSDITFSSTGLADVFLVRLKINKSLSDSLKIQFKSFHILDNVSISTIFSAY